MKLPSKRSALWPTVVLALTAVLVSLGVLQYRWSKEVSEAASARMRADLVRSMVDFRRDFSRELASVARALEPYESDRPDFESYAREWAKWRRSATHPSMVQEVYLWQPGRARSQLLKIKLPGEDPEHVDWPPELEPIRAMEIASLPGSRILMTTPEPSYLGLGHIPHENGQVGFTFGLSPQAITTVDEAPFAVVQGSLSVAGPPPEALGGSSRRFHPHQGQSPPNVVQFQQRGVVTVGRLPWMLIASVPALVHPLVLPPAGDKPPGHGCRADCAGWIIIPLNQAFLAQHLFPELVARHFSTLDYQVSVVAGQKGDRVVYSSDSKTSARSIADADASMSLFAVPGSPHPLEAGLAGLPRLKGVTSDNDYADAQRIFGGEEAMELLAMPAASPQSGWQLVVNNRQGSLEAAVEALRRRNLAISFGVLLVLAATMGIIIFATKRVQALAKLQMDFVAGVSHELRTPLTVISSAADNIADGVVESKEQMAHYGMALKGQARQLKELVEQILLFAATRKHRQSYSLRPATVRDALDLALENTAELIRAAGFEVECRISHDLPHVFIDVQALARCLQNLIINAIKYGGEARWIGIEAENAEDGAGVTISVRDRGIGISAGDMKHIFEPFYRSPSVRDAQIHGSGLGLPVAKSIVESMGGRISVESEPGGGSSFTVYLPVAEAMKEQAVQSSPSVPLKVP